MKLSLSSLRATMIQTGLVGLLTFAWTLPTPIQADTLASNLSASSNGTLTVDADYAKGVAFKTPAGGSITLTSVTLPLIVTDNSSALVVKLYRVDGEPDENTPANEPESTLDPAINLTPTTSFAESGSVVEYQFSPSGGSVVLQADTWYWITAETSGNGLYDWSYTTLSTGTPDPIYYGYSDFDPFGTGWQIFGTTLSGFPFRFQVEGSIGGAATYTVTYNGNNNTGGSVPTDGNSYSGNATVTVLGNTGNLTRTGYSFDGWNTQADGLGTPYDPSDTFSISSNTTLYAQWIVDYAGWSGGASQTADANNDGVTNLMAYALGAATVNTNARSLLPTLSKVSGGYKFAVGNSTRTDVTYQIQMSTSTSLSSSAWTNSTLATGGIIAQKSPGGSWTENTLGTEPNGITVTAVGNGVEVTDTNSTARRFWRLVVSVP